MGATTDVDVAVIGRGMIGSAAARHLAEGGHRVALVGSGEPADYATAAGPFSSHYDEGRITRISSANPVWAELAARSIRRYADIEGRSGMVFHDPRGLAQASGVTDASVANARARGGSARTVDREWLFETTGIAIPASHPGSIFVEDAPAGVINPRRLVAAQVALAVSAGAVVIDHPVTSVRRTPGVLAIEAGTTLNAGKVILATGAYGASLVGVDLALERRLRTIVLAELGAGEEIPSLIVDPVDHPALEEIYWVPPVPYPDGRTMLKIGGNSLPLVAAEQDHDIDRWFRAGGSIDETVALQDTVRALLPGADVRSWDHHPCVVTYTDTGLPYVGHVDDDVVVATGACGAGAKSSDELGRLAATLVDAAGWTDDEITESAFTPVLR